MRTLQSAMSFHNKCIISMDRLDLTNGIRSEVTLLPGCTFPLKAFPQKIQKLILDLEHYENFNVEYCASVILSVVAAATGNSLMVNIKGEWNVNSALYIMLVGRAGLGKTPPMNYLYRPIRERDNESYLEYCRQLKEYELAVMQKDKNSPIPTDMPVLEKRILGDFTVEALLSTHWNNPRGVSIVVDEILGLFKSAYRYNSKGDLFELLLSVFSGGPADSTRKSEKQKLVINTPFINLIGSVQTGLMDKIFSKEFKSNGLVDRFLFAYPMDQKMSEWKLEPDGQCPEMKAIWKEIIDKILNFSCECDKEHHTARPKVLFLTYEAKKMLYEWRNRIVRKNNAIIDDREVESRESKAACKVSKIALLLQILRYITGECPLDTVDVTSMEDAILLIEYYENNFHRLEADVTRYSQDGKKGLLDLLGNTFTTREAIEAGIRIGISRRTVFHMLNIYTSCPGQLLIKTDHGVYTKIKVNDSAPCTIALSDDAPYNTLNNCDIDADSECIVQSAEVQSDTNSTDSHE